MEALKSFFVGFWNGFKSFGYTVSIIVNFVLLFIVYFTAVGVTSIIAKMFKKHFLSLESSNSPTNWIDRKQTEQQIENYKRMF